MKLDPEIEYTAWHKPQKQIIFYIQPNTTSLSLSDLPIHAKEIKAHLYIYIGYAAYSGHVSWYFQTLFDGAKISACPYTQQAVSFCNEMVTLQLDGRGFIEVIRDGVYPTQDNFGFKFEILYYR